MFPRSPLLARAIPYLALCTSMVMLASTTSLAKGLFPIVGAAGTSAYRVGLSALVLVLLARPWRWKLTRQDVLRLALFGAVLGAMNLSFYMALRTVPIGITIAIQFAGPLTLALIHSRKPVHFLCIGLALTGLGLLLPLRGGVGALDPLGLVLAALSGLFWALYIVFGKRVSHLPNSQSVSLGMCAAALIVVPFGVAEAGAALLAPQLILLGLGVAIFSSAVPFSLEMVALRSIPKRTYGVVISLEPAIGAVAGLFILHEQLSGQQWLAIATIMAASVGAILTSREPQPVSDPPQASAT